MSERTDTERLDWLERQRRYSPMSHGYHDDRYEWHLFGRGKYVNNGYAPDQTPHDTARAAIDAAMDAELRAAAPRRRGPPRERASHDLLEEVTDEPGTDG